MGKENWVATRDGKVCAVFENRKKAIKWAKMLLAQTLRDLKPQDNNDEYDYPIEFPRYEIKPVENRKTFLGL